MNREQKRNYTKKLKQKGYSESQIELALRVVEMKSKSLVDEEFLENDKVKLNYENITSHPDYIKNKTSEESHVIRYHKFIEDNKDKVMTVQYDKNHQDHPQLVVLKEDENEDDCKWLFWVGDLIKIKDDIKIKENKNVQ